MARWLHSAAGNICSIMHWAIGFRELGWEVWIAEDLSSQELQTPESPEQASPQEEYWNWNGRDAAMPASARAS